MRHLRTFPDRQDFQLFPWLLFIWPLLLYATAEKFYSSATTHSASAKYVLSQVAVGILLGLAYLTFNTANKKERVTLQTQRDTEEAATTGQRQSKSRAPKAIRLLAIVLLGSVIFVGLFGLIGSLISFPFRERAGVLVRNAIWFDELHNRLGVLPIIRGMDDYFSGPQIQNRLAWAQAMMFIASFCAFFCAVYVTVIFVLALTYRNRGTVRERVNSLLRFSISFPLLLSATNYFILQLALSTWLLSSSCNGLVCMLSVDSLACYAGFTTIVPYALAILTCCFSFISQCQEFTRSSCPEECPVP
jgi:hypothetical protein